MTDGHDANRNLTGNGSNTCNWDARNHLTSITGGTAAAFTYYAMALLRDRNPHQLMHQAAGQLIIVSRHLADELELPINVNHDDERCIVVAQGVVGDGTAIAPTS